MRLSHPLHGSHLLALCEKISLRHFERRARGGRALWSEAMKLEEVFKALGVPDTVGDLLSRRSPDPNPPYRVEPDIMFRAHFGYVRHEEILPFLAVVKQCRGRELPADLAGFGFLAEALGWFRAALELQSDVVAVTE